MTSLKRFSLAGALAIFVAVPATAQAASDNELVFFSYTPINEIDWSRPDNALRSTFKSQLGVAMRGEEDYKSVVGHVFVRYRCRRTDGRLRDIWTGMTGQNEKTEDKSDLFDKKVGLGILFKDYRDGQIQATLDDSADHLGNYLGRKERNAEGKRERLKPLFLRFKISSTECDQIDDYHNFMWRLSWDGRENLSSYKAQRDRDILYFGFNFKNPHLLYKQKLRDRNVRIGTGCTEFAASFMKMLDVFDPIFERSWRRDLKVSTALMGGSDPWGRHREVSVPQILGRLGNKWQHEGWPDRKLYFYDTEKIWDFLDGVRTCAGIRDGRIRAGIPAKNCSADIDSWVRRNRRKLDVNDTYDVWTRKVDVTRRQVGRPGSGHTVTERRHYAEWVTIEGITIER
jgi:hypothetical protein